MLWWRKYKITALKRSERYEIRVSSLTCRNESIIIDYLIFDPTTGTYLLLLVACWWLCNISSATENVSVGLMEKHCALQLIGALSPATKMVVCPTKNSSCAFWHRLFGRQTRCWGSETWKGRLIHKPISRAIQTIFKTSYGDEFFQLLKILFSLCMFEEQMVHHQTMFSLPIMNCNAPELGRTEAIGIGTDVDEFFCFNQGAQGGGCFLFCWGQPSQVLQTICR